jgi:hypothetical protein
LPDATLKLKLFVRAARGTPLYALSTRSRDVIFLEGGLGPYASATVAEPALRCAVLLRLLGDPAAR